MGDSIDKQLSVYNLRHDVFMCSPGFKPDLLDCNGCKYINM